MMQESRRKAKKKREEIKRLLAESRSGALPFLEYPKLESIPNLIQDLNDFIQNNSTPICQSSFDVKPGFQLNHYREHILSILGWNSMLFSDIVPLVDDYRLDRIWRFVTLVFMQNDREVDLTQYGSDLLVQRNSNEAYSKG
jgi:hypothetical protein